MLTQEPPTANLEVEGHTRDDAGWQTKLLPLMRMTLIFLALFFFIVSCVQLAYLNHEILNTPAVDVQNSLAILGKAPSQNFQDTLAATRQNALVILEANATTAQYHQAGVLLAGRLWTTYLGFVTGMILAFVGATFVLGKLQESSSELNTKVAKVEVSFKSTSPGLMLAVLGVTLMICTILTHNNIDVTQRAIYLSDSTPLSENTNDASHPPAKPGQKTPIATGQTERPPAFVIPNPTTQTKEKPK